MEKMMYLMLIEKSKTYNKMTKQKHTIFGPITKIY